MNFKEVQDCSSTLSWSPEIPLLSDKTVVYRVDDRYKLRLSMRDNHLGVSEVGFVT